MNENARRARLAGEPKADARDRRRSISQEAIIAALPPLLLGLALSQLIFFVRRWYLATGSYRWDGAMLASIGWSFAVALAVGAILVIGGAAAAMRRLPRWGYTWAAGGLMAVFLLGTLLSDDAEMNVGWAVYGLALLVLGFTLFWAAARRGWQWAMLVSLAMTALFATGFTFFAIAAPFARFDIALAAAPVGFVFALLIYFFMIGDDGARPRLLAVGSLLALGVAALYVGVTWEWAATHGSYTFVWTLAVFILVLTLAGPLLSRLQRLRKRS